MRLYVLIFAADWIIRNTKQCLVRKGEKTTAGWSEPKYYEDGPANFPHDASIM